MSWNNNKCCPYSLKDIEVTCCCDSSSIFLHLSLAVERQTLLFISLCSFSSHLGELLLFDKFLVLTVGWRLSILHHPVVQRSLYNTERSTPTRKVLLSQEKLKQDLKQLQNWELEMSGVTVKAAPSLLAHYNSKPVLFVITGIIAMVRGPIGGKGLIVLSTVWACYKMTQWTTKNLEKMKENYYPDCIKGEPQIISLT